MFFFYKKKFKKMSACAARRYDDGLDAFNVTLGQSLSEALLGAAVVVFAVIDALLL